MNKHILVWSSIVIFSVSFWLIIILACTNAHAATEQEAWTIKSYATHAYPEAKTCVKRARLAKMVAESRGWEVKEVYETKENGKRHVYLVLKKDGITEEILH